MRCHPVGETKSHDENVKRKRQRNVFEKREACKDFRRGFGTPEIMAKLQRQTIETLGGMEKMSLSEAISEKPEESEVAIFQNFAAKMMGLQHQLHEDYHTDRSLRDCLMKALDLPLIRDALRERVPRTSQKLINRVAGRLSVGRKSAREMIAHQMEELEEEE